MKKKDNAMSKTIFKTKKWKYYLSGSLSKPYAHLWKEEIGTSYCQRNYKAVNIFIYQCSKFVKRYPETDKLELDKKYLFKWKRDNSVPKWIQKAVSIYHNWQNFTYFYDDAFDEHGQFIENYVPIKRPSLLNFAFNILQVERKQRKCKHPHMIVDSCITPDSGSEYFYCPDCGFSQNICYY